MPLVNSVMPQGDWRKWEVTPLHFRLGDFLGTVVDFTIVAFVVFIVMVKLVGKVNKKAVATRTCPECLDSVPVAAKRCRSCTSVLTAIAIALMLAAPAPASAQTNPAFVFAKPEEAKAGTPPPPPVEWKAQIKDGNDGNVGELAERRRKRGRCRCHASRTQTSSPSTLPPHTANRTSSCRCSGTQTAPTTITSLERRSSTTTNNWSSRGPLRSVLHHQQRGLRVRSGGGDRIAGKSLIGGGQVGYSRQLIKNDRHTLVSEIGYDFSNEHYVRSPCARSTRSASTRRACSWARR